MTENGTAKYRRDQKRRLGTAAGAALMAALASGAMIYAVHAERHGGGLSPAWAILLTLFFVAIFLAANWVYLRDADELTWAHNISAGFWTLIFFAMLYPAWLILWAGDLLPEPEARPLYLITLGFAAAVYGWKRFR